MRCRIQIATILHQFFFFWNARSSLTSPFEVFIWFYLSFPCHCQGSSYFPVIFSEHMPATCPCALFYHLCRSLIANLSAANCYKSEHLKRPENWALGIIFFLDASIPCLLLYNMLNFLFYLNSYFDSWKGQIFLYCWFFPDCVPWINSTRSWTCSCKQ